MFWLFAMAVTVGLVLGIPAALQTIDAASSSTDDLNGDEADALAAEARTRSGTLFGGFVLLFGGLGGLLALAFEPATWVALVVALCLGLAAGALHPEVLGAFLRPADEL